MVRLDLECLVQQVPDRQPLQHQDRALLVGDVVGQLDQFFPGNVALAGVAAEIEIIGDAVAGVKIGHAGPNCDNLAGGFVAGDERQPRRLVEAGAVIDVDEIQADGMLADVHLAGSRRGHIHGLVNQGFRAPYLVHAHGLGHRQFLPRHSLAAEAKAIEAGVVNSTTCRPRQPIS